MNSVEFNPDGTRVLTSSDEGDARIWYVDYREFVAFACQRLIRDFTEIERQNYGIIDTQATCPG